MKLLIASLIACASCTEAQSLQIIAPLDGTVVSSGQTFAVAVGTSGTFESVVIFTQTPLPTSEPLTSAPFQFSIVIPQGTAPGPYSLTATGIISPGLSVDSL